MASSEALRRPKGPPLHVTIRFTTDLPDLPIDVAAPATTTVVALRHLIRSQLPAAVAAARLRLIYSGKILPDAALLTAVIRVTPPPPPPLDPKGKAKELPHDALPAPIRTYLNCSIGDDLTADELAAEARAATVRDATSRSSHGGWDEASSSAQPAASTTPAPRGFDRLLSTGFTAAEVGQLRLQFLSIQARMHTPDTMPSPATLRRMEDAWMDDNGAGGGGPAPELLGDGGGVSGGALDDLLLGNLIGLFWPLGAIGWLIREQGVWSERRQYAIFLGFIASLLFGAMHLLT